MGPDPREVSLPDMPADSGVLTQSAAADPDTYQIMQITQEQAGEGSQHGKVILSGTAQNVSH